MKANEPAKHKYRTWKWSSEMDFQKLPLVTLLGRCRSLSLCRAQTDSLIHHRETGNSRAWTGALPAMHKQVCEIYTTYESKDACMYKKNPTNEEIATAFGVQWMFVSAVWLLTTFLTISSDVLLILGCKNYYTYLNTQKKRHRYTILLFPLF